jgi:hypothetical protein
MAYVPDIKQPGYAPAWQNKKADGQHEFQTMDGSEYIVYVPSSNQLNAYEKSLKKYKDVFDQIKADVKDNAAIAKNRDGLPNNLDHVEWAELLSSIFKKLDKTWKKNDKIWFRNKNDDGTKYQQPVLAITPKIAQRNAKRGRKTTHKKSSSSSSKKGKKTTQKKSSSSPGIDSDEIEFGPPITAQVIYVKTKNGLTYNYRTKADADNDNYFKIENADRERVNESGKRINPDGTLMKINPKSEDEYDYDYESDKERNDYDYNNGIPPYEGAMWDDEFEVWASNPIDPEIYDEEGNYRIPPEDIVVEPEPEPAPMPAPAPALIQQQESRIDQLRRRRREMMRARATAAVAPITAVALTPAPPTPPIEDPRIVEARIGLPSPWEAHISNTYNVVYYFDPRNGDKQWEKPTMGGKRTRKRSRPRGRQPKRKRSTTRRK